MTSAPLRGNHDVALGQWDPWQVRIIETLNVPTQNKRIGVADFLIEWVIFLLPRCRWRPLWGDGKNFEQKNVIQWACVN